jgi:hypothetical protein
VSLEALYLAAWIEGLKARTPEPAVRPVAHLTGHVLLRDTDRAPYVPLRGAGGDRAER